MTDPSVRHIPLPADRLVGSFRLDEPELFVLDTDVVIQDLFHVLRDRPSSLLMLGNAGAARLVAARHVYDELYRKIPLVARNENLDEPKMLRLWEERYRPLIRFVELPRGTAAVAQVVRALSERDASDVPTLQLALLLAPCHLLTANRRHFGEYAPANWLEVVLNARDKAIIDEGLHGMALVGGAAGASVWGLGRATLRAVRASPVAAITIGVAAGTGLLRYVIEPERAASSRRAATGRMRNAVRLFGELLERLSERRAYTLLELAAERVKPMKDSPPAAKIARLLAVAEAPVPESDLVKRFAATDKPGSPAECLGILRAHPAFVETATGWELGATLSRRSASAHA